MFKSNIKIKIGNTGSEFLVAYTKAMGKPNLNSVNGAKVKSIAQIKPFIFDYNLKPFLQ